MGWGHGRDWAGRACLGVFCENSPLAIANTAGIGGARESGLPQAMEREGTRGTPESP